MLNDIFTLDMEKLSLVIAFLSMLLFVHLSDSCCIPKQFEGFEELVAVGVNTGIHTRSLYRIHLDSTNKKIALTGNATYNGTLVKEQILHDFNAMKQYVVKDGKCSVTEIGGGMVVCIPPEAKLFMSTYYGIGNNKVDIDVYMVTNGSYATAISVTKNECAPMTQRRESKAGITDVEFRGVTLGIKDMSVFDVPKACQNGTSTSPFSGMMHRMMETRHSVFLRHN